MPSRALTRLLWTAVIFLALIGVAAAVIRGVRLTRPPTERFDAAFWRHPALTFVHIIPGTLFMILGPFQFVKSLRTRRPALHRWSGRAFIALSYIIGVSALAMSFQMSIGGANETAATTLFAIWFLFALTKGFLHALRRNFNLHREWMIRAYAIGLAVATVRPIIGAFFASRRLSPQEFFGIAFWIGFTLHLIAAEMWINYTRTGGALPDGRGSDRSRARQQAVW
jgi:uncharacterized membrane protein